MSYSSLKQACANRCRSPTAVSDRIFGIGPNFMSLFVCVGAGVKVGPKSPTSYSTKPCCKYCSSAHLLTKLRRKALLQVCAETVELCLNAAIKRGVLHPSGKPSVAKKNEKTKNQDAIFVFREARHETLSSAPFQCIAFFSEARFSQSGPRHRKLEALKTGR